MCLVIKFTLGVMFIKMSKIFGIFGHNSGRVVIGF